MKKIYFMFLVMFFAGLRIGYAQDDIVVNNDPGICGAVVNYNLPEPGQISIEPIADSYVSNISATSNFGTSDRLNVDPTEYGGSRIEYTYLKFDVTSLPPGATITGVKLQMQSWGGYAYGGDGNVYNLFVADDSWTETGIIWNNAPAATTNLGYWWQWCNNFSNCNATVINSNPALASQVVTELSGDGTISIRLHSPGYVTYYRSREYGTASQRPKLIIDYNYAVTQTAGLSSGSTFPKGTTTNTFVATDVAGNTATFNFDVTVNDTEVPVINCPADIISDNDPGKCDAVVSFSLPSVTDNCLFPSANLAGFTTLGVYNGNTYYLSNALFLGPNAFADAVSKGGFLASINSEQENTFVRNAANSVAGAINILIGFNDVETEGTFVWQNGDPVSYTNWNGGEPNDAGGEDYTQILPSGKWNDVPGYFYTYRYVLELKGSLVQTTGLPSGSVFPAGTTTNTFLATDGSGNTATCSFTVKVNDTEEPTIDCPANILADNDPGACGAVVTYSVSSDDNCPGQSVEQTAGLASGSEFPVGTTTNTFVVTDAAGNTATCSFDVTVNDTEAPTINCPSDVVADNDPSVCGAVVTYNVSSDDNCPGQTVTQTAGLASGSEFPVGTTTNTFVVTDASGNTETCSFTVTVNNTLPEVTIVSGPATPVALGNSISLSISHNDNNLTNATIDWDDLTPIENVTNPSTGSFDVSHTYATPGVYTVSVTLTDACDEVSETYHYQYVVIYDPNGGFVTGGGWFWSEACAYKDAEGVSGRANFGFVAKYKRGSTVPDGNTEFQFKAGNLNFHSSQYDDMRLVIAGARANYKGVGYIKGSDHLYGFMVSAIDGNVSGGGGTDKFRIKIWDKDDNDRIVYDNNCTETDENSDPATAIGGGSIVIHSTAKTKSAEIATAIEPEVGFSELKAYPNPFSDKLFFEFSREVDSKATLILFDGVGRKISVLFDQQIQANQNYRIEYVPNELSTNMLFYRMTFDNEVINGKVIYKK